MSLAQVFAAITPEQFVTYLQKSGTLSVTTVSFLVFFALVAVVNYALPRVLRPYYLLAVSIGYFCYEPSYRPLLWALLGLAGLSWLCGLIIGRVRCQPVRVLALLTAIAGSVGLLFYYKYWNMAADIAARTPLAAVLSHRESILAPMGLSYFALSSLSYPIDVFKRRCKVESNLLHYALFVCYFPTLITGPIERYPHLRPQIKKSRRFSYNRCAGGAFRMLWGYTKKMVIADNLNLYISSVYQNAAEMSGPNLLAATLLFAVRLYMDFSGCCDIVLGASRILGYDLLENFKAPLEARTFGAVWRRWHISMSSWFRDYVYIPLGGSRCSVWRHCLNTMIVFTVSGIWHGADWRYMMWGAACGVVCVVSILTAKPRQFLADHNPLYKMEWFKVLFQTLCADVLFALVFVFFNCALLDVQPSVIFAGLTKGWHGIAPAFAEIAASLTASGLDGRMPVVLTFSIFVVFAVEHGGRNVARWIREQPWPLRWTLYYAASAAILFFAAFGQSAFIYQNY